MHSGISSLVRAARQWSKSSTTSKWDVEPRRFRVTHPFHPLYGREFEWETYHHNWGEPWVYYRDDQDRIVAIRCRWTSMVEPEPIVALAKGRSMFRVEDLLTLSRLVETLNTLEEQK